MSERCDATLAARLAMAMDGGTLAPLIALDEGAEPDEQTPAALAERLAFRIDLDFGTAEIGLLADADEIDAARTTLTSVKQDDNTYEVFAALCFQLGIHSQRHALFALRAARAHAALAGADHLRDEDIEAAAALCLAHRATRLPPPPAEEEPEQETEQPQNGDQNSGEDKAEPDIGTLDDRVLEAVMAVLPEGLLDHLKPKPQSGKGTGAGAKQRSNRRGRPKPSRTGRLDGRNRLDLIATLRTAAPMQKLRGAEPGKLRVMPSDFRIRQYEEKSDRLLIFAVDASGSSAIARLAEAKGAVELLLADAYSRRDHVSLIAFRGTQADILLPPTRSLVQTKRRLAALPGGGGTPLASGLLEALTLAHQSKSHGMTPCIILLTDGRANITLDGTADRPQASADSEAIAKQIIAAGIDTIVLDLGKRPAQFLEDLSARMGGSYLPLPRADSQKMSGAVSAILAD
jgi:magnesium chelatase subunit D